MRQIGVGQVLLVEWLGIVVQTISQVTARLQKDYDPLVETEVVFFM